MGPASRHLSPRRRSPYLLVAAGASREVSAPRASAERGQHRRRRAPPAPPASSRAARPRHRRRLSDDSDTWRLPPRLETGTCAEAKDSGRTATRFCPRGGANAASPSHARAGAGEECGGGGGFRGRRRRRRQRVFGLFRPAAARRRSRERSFRAGAFGVSESRRPLPRGARPRGTPRVTARRPARKCTCSRTRTSGRRRTRSRFRRGTSCAACARSRWKTRRCPSTRGAARRCATPTCRAPPPARTSPRASRGRRGDGGGAGEGVGESDARIEGGDLADKKVAFARIRDASERARKRFARRRTT